MSYNVVWSANATSSRATLAGGIGRLEQALTGACWALERKPFLFEKVKGTAIRLMPLGPLPNIEGEIAFKVILAFTLSERKVEILWLEATSLSDEVD